MMLLFMTGRESYILAFAPYAITSFPAVEPHVADHAKGQVEFRHAAARQSSFPHFLQRRQSNTQISSVNAALRVASLPRTDHVCLICRVVAFTEQRISTEQLSGERNRA